MSSRTETFLAMEQECVDRARHECNPLVRAQFMAAAREWQRLGMEARHLEGDWERLNQDVAAFEVARSRASRIVRCPE
jgi:hypothetical protein